MKKIASWVICIVVVVVIAFYALNAYIRYQELHGGLPTGPNLGGEVNTPVRPTNPDGERQRPDMPLTGLIGGGWTWQRTVWLDGKSDEAPAGKFVLSLDEDGQMSSKTDCNAMAGDYRRTDNELTFGPIAMTKMYCEGSREGEYAKGLEQVQHYEIRGGELHLTLKDGGVMVFTRAAAESEAAPK